ncbi:MAG: hypothetical protein JSU08_14825 [Acidobacteria bacterium]|nr:hypothetical protein [Acidobacteriota bacterium]
MRAERGAALLTVVMAMALFLALGSALVIATTADIAITANAGASTTAAFAASAALDRSLAELRMAPDVTSVLDGSFTSQFVDGVPIGGRTLADGSSIDLGRIVNLANCHKAAGCTPADLAASFAERPWGGRNPVWRLFSYGPLDGVTGLGPRGSPVYVTTMVADDPAETDNDPARDGGRTGAAMNPGAGMLLVRAEAFGPRSADRVIDAVVLRLDRREWARWDAADPAVRGPEPMGLPRLQVLSWREVR